jgi:hypothetical protein
VRKSSDAGTTWTTVDDYQPGPILALGAITASPQGDVYAFGLEGDQANTMDVIRNSRDGGKSWQVVEDISDYLGSTCSAAAVSPSGAVYAAYISPELTSAIVESTDHGKTWTTVDSSGTAWFPGLSFDASGTLIEAGAFEPQGQSPSWFVRQRSSDAAAWTTLDMGTSWGRAQACSIGPTGALYAAGEMETNEDAGIADQWTVRRQKTPGSAWETIDAFGVPMQQITKAMGVYEDGAGSLIAVGAIAGPLGFGSPPITAAVRRSDDGGATWTTTDMFPNSSDNMTLTADRQGNLYFALEFGALSSGPLHGVVRKLSCK